MKIFVSFFGIKKDARCFKLKLFWITSGRFGEYSLLRNYANIADSESANDITAVGSLTDVFYSWKSILHLNDLNFSDPFVIRLTYRVGVFTLIWLDVNSWPNSGFVLLTSCQWNRNFMNWKSYEIVFKISLILYYKIKTSILWW